MTLLEDVRVAVSFSNARYAATPPYHPARAYPEYPFADAVGNEANCAYDSVRSLFETLQFDAGNIGTAHWNPLGFLIQPGNTVVLKPNFVVSHHARGGDLFAAITHPSVLRAIIDYVYIALENRGRIVIADAPQMDCDWDELMRALRMDLVREFYANRTNVSVDILDLRDFAIIDSSEVAYATNRKPLPGDPLGEVVFDLAERSHFAGFGDEDKFYGADYDRTETIRNHSHGVHRYSVSRTILAADAVISVPKLKVHKMVGVTLNVKGLVGTTTRKNQLVHYRLGSPSDGGDQLPDGIQGADRILVRVQRVLFDKFLARQNRVGDLVYRAAQAIYIHVVKRFVRKRTDTAPRWDEGNWHGNDTAWRMALDLLKIFLYGSASGGLANGVQRRVFCIVDGIIGGENNGPLVPDAKPAGCMIAGANPMAVDVVATRLMGFDPRAIRQFSALEDHRGFDWGFRRPADVKVLSAEPEIRRMFTSDSRFLAFQPHPGWVGFVEFPNVLCSEDQWNLRRSDELQQR